MAAPMADKKPSPVMVGRQFIKKYYERLDKNPETVYKFYQENSTLIYGEGTAPEESVVGIEAIKEKLAARCGQGFFLSLEHGTVDAQQSIEGGVLLMVTGTITRKGSDTPSQFVQSFFLAEQAAAANANAASYFVLNDTFRVIDASGTAAPSSSAAAAAAAAAPPAAAPKPAAPPKAKPPAPKPVATEAPPKPSETAAPTNGAAATGAAPGPPAKAAPAAAPAAAPVAAPAPTPAAAAAPKPPAPPAKPASWAAMAAAASTQAPAASVAPPRSAAAAPTRRAAPAPAAAAPVAPSPATTAAPASAAAASDASAQVKNPSAEEMPSSAVFVKNIDTTTSEKELKECFLVFMEEPDVGKMLIANNVDRGYAFVDLGTTEAVARAVSASRGDGITLKDKKLTVEPSKKPVRPSGLKAIAERKGAPGSGAKGSSGGKGKAGKGGKGNKMAPAR